MDYLHPTTTADRIDADACQTPGRSCPLHYRYAPHSFRREAETQCDTLYVVGGLYGNAVAMDSVMALFDREPGAKRLVFNGDFNWFNVDPEGFVRLNQQVLEFDALRGNVETELAAPTDADAGDLDDAGCGCAYPAWVDDGVVERSNRIIGRLRATARRFPALTQQLARLDMHRRVDVGGLRVAIVHGDAESLAGWGFAQEQLRERAHRQRVRSWFDAAQVDVFACSHTCLPVFHTLPMAGRPNAPMVLNNGAAGLPNFKGQTDGLLTRISVRPFVGPERCFGQGCGGLHVDAISIPINQHDWGEQFLRQWPQGSDAHLSYWRRISQGPDYDAAQALVSSAD
jgi:hypothetical protein